jgi:ABC-type branched-subunit amino acid transport system ATPase component
MTAQPLLICDGVAKHFGSLAAVDGFSLVVNEGEIVGIGGPNGAGKTTLFDVVTGLTPITKGRVWFAETEITGWSADRICQLGIARTFQLNAAFDSLTVRENVELAAYYGRSRRRLPGFRLDRSTIRAAAEALDFVGLADKAGMSVGQLPVLDRKLLMIAGAVATQPRMIFLDEPVGGLTHSEIDRILALVQKVRAQGVTIVLIEHVMRFLMALSSRVVIMHHGRTIFEGRPENVAEDATVVETYLGAGARDRLKRYFADSPTGDAGTGEAAHG